MRKGDNGDGVSHIGDAAVNDDADPEVTAITRRFDRTGDTLGAIDELEQLLIKRTGQIPVVTPELLAAHAARLERARPEPEAAPEVAAQPEVATTPAQGSTDEASGIDWSIPAPAPLDPAPGFSAWVDPDAIAAAVDTSTPEFTDVSTKVFAVFSADRVAPEPGPEPAPAETAEPAPVAAPPVDEELDGIDDLAEPAPAPGPSATPEPAEMPEPTSAPVPPPAAEEPPQKRRFWPFGRR